MEQKTRILIVEDDMIIAANISVQLSNLGYEVMGIETRERRQFYMPPPIVQILYCWILI